ncbi:MAG: hypothetical protein ACP5M0_11835 [Desulfomonilaceae bacterium]
MEEKDLTEKQRSWLEASRKIGPGPMTKSERTLLERLYADMEPREQQDLYNYIQMKFGDKETKQRDSEDQAPDDPISRMQGKMWSEPSGAFKKAFATIRRTTPPGR